MSQPLAPSTPTDRPSRGWFALGGIVLLGGLAVLFVFDPAHSAFFPHCLFRELTGCDCPGCGGTRALHQLTHGNLAAAFQLNPLFVLLLPWLAWTLTRQAVLEMTGRRLPAAFARPAYGWALLGVGLLFTIARNLPWPAFAWLKW